MKTLKESILDDDEDILDNTKIDEVKIVTDFINSHYDMAKQLKLNKSNRTVDADEVIMQSKTAKNFELPLGWRWGKTKKFNCRYSNITSLSGAPEKCADFDCAHCQELISLEGAPEECEVLDCNMCISLKTLEGAPKKCDYFYCSSCDNLVSLKGAPKYCKHFDCSYCRKLISLKGAPKNCTIYCHYCDKLIDKEREK